MHGPGVGAVACHPTENKAIFIHGLLNCNEQHPYGFTRRFGAILAGNTDTVLHAEARTIHESSNGLSKDLRTIGVMAPLHSVNVPIENAENFSGEYFAVVAATVTENAVPGSSEIERAFDECWVGKDGYIKADGTQQKRAIAFQGNVRGSDGSVITEVFVADVPHDITQATEGKPLEGTLHSRPNVPKGLVQRRITFTSGQNHAGIQGPRFRLRTSPDGQEIYFLMRDKAGNIQVYAVSTLGGDIRQITHLDYSVQSQFNVSPNGKQLTLVADNSIWLIDIANGETKRLTARTNDDNVPVGGVLWSNSGKMLVYNRYVGISPDRYLQIIRLELE
jgi:hypothetical protein